MLPVYHTAISAGAGIAVTSWLKSPAAGVACFLGGIFIDLDHHLDFYFARKKIPWSYKELSHFCATDLKGKLYLVFHSYELFFILWLSVFVFGFNEWILGMLIGATLHLLCDQFANPLVPLAYVFIYRWRNGFERKHIMKKEYYEKIAGP